MSSQRCQFNLHFGFVPPAIPRREGPPLETPSQPGRRPAEHSARQQPSPAGAGRRCCVDNRRPSFQHGFAPPSQAVGPFPRSHSSSPSPSSSSASSSTIAPPQPHVGGPTSSSHLRVMRITQPQSSQVTFSSRQPCFFGALEWVNSACGYGPMASVSCCRWTVNSLLAVRRRHFPFQAKGLGKSRELALVSRFDTDRTVDQFVDQCGRNLHRVFQHGADEYFVRLIGAVLRRPRLADPPLLRGQAALARP